MLKLFHTVHVLSHAAGVGHFLLRPQQRLHGTVMGISDCMPVCLSMRISPEPHVIFTKFFVHVAYVHGPVFLRHIDDRPHYLSVGRERQQCTVRAKCNLRLPCLRFCTGPWDAWRSEALVSLNCLNSLQLCHTELWPVQQCSSCWNTSWCSKLPAIIHNACLGTY